MHKNPERFRLAVSFTSLVVCALIMAGCHNSSDAVPGKTTVPQQTVPPFIVTAAPGTVKPAAATPAMNKHSARGVSCEQCHETAAPTMAPNSNKACLTCHDAAEVIKATAKYDNVAKKLQNPHDSHMHGASCLVCHKNHSKSVLYCDQCHNPKFNWNVP